METLTDASPMPFGKHRGTPMEKVPARYLLWLDSQWDGVILNEDQKAVRAYIESNRRGLEQEEDE